MTFALMCQPMVNLHSLKGSLLVSRCPTFDPSGDARRLANAALTAVTHGEPLRWTGSPA
ncbi:MAG: hypothetical protein V7K54_14160 [Nostoc sp.]